MCRYDVERICEPMEHWHFILTSDWNYIFSLSYMISLSLLHDKNNFHTKFSRGNYRKTLLSGRSVVSHLITDTENAKVDNSNTTDS